MSSLGFIIPAAGSGRRMGTDIPKPFIELAGEPLIVHTLRRLLEYDQTREVAIACSTDWMSRVEVLVRPLCEQAEAQCHIVEGGQERQDSVYRGLLALNAVDLIAVHDAVRPFVKPENIRKCCEKAAKEGAAILGVPVRDTIKIVNDDRSIRETPDRRRLWKAQTPQVFQAGLLKKAFEEAGKQEFVGTDDASLLEWMGQKVFVVEGSQDNFKITYPSDLERAAQRLNRGEING